MAPVLGIIPPSPPQPLFFRRYPSSPRLHRARHRNPPSQPLCAAIPFHPHLAHPRLSSRTKGISPHFVTGCLDEASAEVFIRRSHNKWQRAPTSPHPPPWRPPRDLLITRRVALKVGQTSAEVPAVYTSGLAGQIHGEVCRP